MSSVEFTLTHFLHLLRDKHHRNTGFMPACRSLNQALLEYEESLQIGDRVRACWVAPGRKFMERDGEVIKINRGSIRILVRENGREFKVAIPRHDSWNWTARNTILLQKKEE